LKPNNFLLSLLPEVAGGLGHQAASTMNDIGRALESAWKVANNVCLQCLLVGSKMPISHGFRFSLLLAKCMQGTKCNQRCEQKAGRKLLLPEMYVVCTSVVSFFFFKRTSSSSFDTLKKN